MPVTLENLFETLPQRGVVEWIGLRPGRREAMLSVAEVAVDAQTGLHGDRYQGRSGKRHVTLIQAEHLPVIASCSGHKEIQPHTLRRNLLIRGINLLALKDKVISIGAVRVEITGACHPCSRMEELLGPGGYNAMRGHGGMTGRILDAGHIRVGDEVRYSSS